jgi:phage pi2 protein 07
MEKETITITKEEYEELKKKSGVAEEMNIVDDITEGLKDITAGNVTEI